MRQDRGVILDIDGTLVDSNDEHARAWVDTLAERGITVAFETVRPLVGMGGDKVLPRISGGIRDDSPEGEALSARRGAIFRERYLPRVSPFPGTRELIQRMRDDGFAIGIASSASEEDLHALLEQAGVADLIDTRTSSDNAERSKPDPDIVHAALARMGLAPERVVMIGDTPYDVEAANRSRVACIAFRCGGWWRDEDLKQAAAIYDGPADLLAHFDASPLGRLAQR
jgi:HAD superfamily hydrolase (TIGR01509 family)